MDPWNYDRLIDSLTRKEASMDRRPKLQVDAKVRARSLANTTLRIVKGRLDRSPNAQASFNDEAEEVLVEVMATILELVGTLALLHNVQVTGDDKPSA